MQQLRVDVVTALTHTLGTLALKPPKYFSGLGVILYHDHFLNEGRMINLRPEYVVPSPLHLASEDTHDYLKDITSGKNVLHDGYVLVSMQGLITHVAHFVQPPISMDISPHQELGTRYLSSALLSTLESIHAVGTISSKGKAMIFQDGQCSLLEQESTESHEMQYSYL